MPKKLSKAQINKALRYSIADGTANAVKNGIIGKFLIPFALALGAGNEYIGLLKALPNLVYTLAQPIAAKVTNIFKSRKFVCTTTALIGRLFWILVLLVPFLFSGSLWWFLFFVCLVYFFNAFTSTAWTSWMADLVPEKIRGKYFGKRYMYAYIAILLSTLFAGWYLGLTNNISGFSVIFAVATLFALISALFLYKIPDIQMKKPHHKMKFSFQHFLLGIREHKDHSNFVVFMMFVTFATQFVSPFFIVYMLKVMNIGYTWFAVVIAAEMILRILSHKYWGRLADRFGDKRILKICYIGVPLTPLLWIFASSPLHAVLIAMIVGFFWSGFELSSFNYLLDSTPKIESPTFIANYKFITGIGSVLGPLLGGIIAVFFAGKTFLIFSGMQILFLIGFILRSIPALMLNRFHHIRVKRRVNYSELFLNAVAIYPLEAIEHGLSHAAHYVHKLEKELEDDIKKK